VTTAACGCCSPTAPGWPEPGPSAPRLAVRAGRIDTAARLRAAGASDDDTDIDHFIGACLNADRSAAESALAGHPGLPGQLTGQDRAVIVDAAGTSPAGAIALMLDLGFSPHARNDLGEQPLHSAAYSGNAEVVRLLLHAGADVDARDARFGSTPLAFATVGSGEQVGKPGDWADTVRLLIEAGASRRGVWISGKPPSEEISHDGSPSSRPSITGIDGRPAQSVPGAPPSSDLPGLIVENQARGLALGCVVWLSQAARKPFMLKPMLTSLIVPGILPVMAGIIVAGERLRRTGRPVGTEGIG
jgi:ankyrin repeat protein